MSLPSASFVANVLVSLAALALVGCAGGALPQADPARPAAPAADMPAASAASAQEKTDHQQAAAQKEVSESKRRARREQPEEARSARRKKDDVQEANDEPVPEIPVGPPPVPALATQQFERALTLMSAGDTAQAEAALKQLSSTYPEYAGPLINLGVLYLKNGKLDDAEKALLTALERSPENAVALNQLGIVYRNRGRFKDADAAYMRAIAADSNYALAHLNRAVLNDLYLQQPDQALLAFERYLAITASPDPKVLSWVKELRTRLGVKTPLEAPKVESEAAPASEATSAVETTKVDQ